MNNLPKNKWLIPEIAPKDGTLFFGYFGHPWPTLTAWNEYEQEWVVAEMEGNICEGKGDPSFIAQYENKKALQYWMPLPEPLNA